MLSTTILYCRKSSEEDDRQSLSLDAQGRECRGYAARKGMAIDRLIREAHSAKRPGRPRFEEMLDEIRATLENGRKVQVICHKPDRLLRNIGDWAKVNDLMEAGVEFLFVTGSYQNNAQGKMAFGINVVFAKYYVDNLSEEVRKGFREKLARGEWPHPAPLGYLNVDRKVVLDPVRAPLVRKAFEYFATGEYSLARLADALHRDGLGGRRLGRRLTKKVLVTHILSNPFYCGLMRTSSGLHPAIHEPLIDTALFNTVRDRLHGKTRSRRVRHEFRFGGLLSCASCGAAVVGDRKKGRYTYYRCSHRRVPCDEGYVREEALDALLCSAVASPLDLPESLARLLRECADSLVRTGREGAEEALAAQKRLGAMDRRLSALVDLRLEGGISGAEYEAKRESLIREQAGLRERLGAFERPGPDYHKLVERFLHTCSHVREAFPRMEDAQLRQLLRIVGSNYRFGNGKVDFEPVEPFATVAQMRNRSLWWRGGDDVRTFVAKLAEYDLPDLRDG